MRELTSDCQGLSRAAEQERNEVVKVYNTKSALAVTSIPSNAIRVAEGDV